MIKLKNGFTIKFNKDFDLFFRDLLESIIKEARKTVASIPTNTNPDESLNDIFLRELMDNCIYVTHQLFELSKTNEELSRFMVAGFIFNSIILSLTQIDNGLPLDGGPDNKDIIH